ncbi:MAG: hypothetical protein OXG44_11355 [Gammaproteobacteria bacterium]|nr:hypothetical protein [Gammaproteobacteria bacterium]
MATPRVYDNLLAWHLANDRQMAFISGPRQAGKTTACIRFGGGSRHADLLKAVEGWTDLGLGDFELGYLRDKEKREVDFVVVRDRVPWFLVDAKADDAPASPALAYFQQKLGAPFAFQVTIRQGYVPRNCFASPGPPLVVPARTFLSQLL